MNRQGDDVPYWSSKTPHNINDVYIVDYVKERSTRPGLDRAIGGDYLPLLSSVSPGTEISAGRFMPRYVFCPYFRQTQVERKFPV